MKRVFSRKKRIVYGIVCLILVLAALLCFGALQILRNLLPPQQEAGRWKGEGDTAFGQVSCYLPVDEKISLNQVYEFRYKILDKLREAGYEADTDTLLFRDAWSTVGKVSVSSSLGHGEANVTAVGGNFFDFHPIHLFHGNYLSEGDLMKDRVLLDEELAWLLFGGTDLQGMEIRINGFPFVVAGVVEREQDFASKKAYTSGMGLFMDYETYSQLVEDTGISCYELVMAEPVDSFTVSFAREKFPIGQGIIVDNNQRFSYLNLLKVIGSYGTRSMQTQGVIYPYWENAARAVEDWCALLLMLGLLCAVFPLVMLIISLVRLLRRGKEKLKDEVIPDLRDRAEEKITRRQHKRWEKKYGKH